MRSAADEKRRPSMRHPERNRGERALRSVAVPFVAADPILALVLAFHIAAPPGDRVALDRLAAKSLALGRPILERAGLKIEVERLAVRSNRPHSFRRRGRNFLLRSERWQ